MEIKKRQQMLAIAAIAVIALLAGDKFVRAPLWNLWTERSKQIADLRKQVGDGAALVQRDQFIRGRWTQMRGRTLPENHSLAEQQVFKAVDGWAQDSRASLNAITPQWKQGDEGYTTLECRVEAAGDLAALSRFLYDAERAPLALKLQAVEFSARDKEGQQLTLGLQVSGLVLDSKTK